MTSIGKIFFPLLKKSTITLMLLANLGWSTPNLRSYVESEAPKVRTVKKIQWDNKSYWIKKSDPSKGYFSCIGKKMAAWILPDKIIIPTPICSGDILQTEASRLEKCEEKQGNCTRLILSGKDWILVSDAGQSFETFLRQHPPHQRRPFMEKGLNAILELHSKGVVQGRASIKDITIAVDGDLTFIDLAEAPENFMSFDEARVRDLLNYFMTTIILLEDVNSKQIYADFFLDKFPKGLKPLLLRVINNTKFLAKIADLISFLDAKDVTKFATTHHILKEKLGL